MDNLPSDHQADPDHRETARSYFAKARDEAIARLGHREHGLFVFMTLVGGLFAIIIARPDGRIYADEWSDAFKYDPDVAIAVLSRFPSGHATTERGDAEVCEALDEAGARI